MTRLKISEEAACWDGLTISQVARLVNSCERSIHRWTNEGSFPKPFWIGSRRFWKKKDVEKYLATRPLSKSRPKNDN